MHLFSIFNTYIKQRGICLPEIYGFPVSLAAIFDDIDISPVFPVHAWITLGKSGRPRIPYIFSPLAWQKCIQNPVKRV